jgi:hypothetical protein
MSKDYFIAMFATASTTSALRRVFVTESPPNGVLWIAVATGAFLVPLFLIYFFVLNDFYYRGANLHDSGFFAHLMWHSDWNLTNPSFLSKAHDLRRSYLAIHISPILWLASAISYILPLDRVQIFALYLAASHAFLGIFMYCILTRWVASSALEIVCAALLSIAFSINGLAIQIAYFPHIEIAIPALLLGTLYFMLSGRTTTAAIFLSLALTVREDAGLHFFGLASLLIVCNLLRGVPLNRQRILVVFLIIAICYSCAAILIQKAFFPEYPGYSAFVRTYSGLPAFAHVTWELLMERLSYYAAHRTYIWGPLMITIGLFIWTRNLYLLVGIGAVLPWLILQTVAVAEAPGTLFGYYAFPFMLTLAWPPFAMALSSQGRMSHWGFWRMMATMTVIVGVSFVPPVTLLNFLRDCVPTRIALNPDPVKKFITAFQAKRASAAYFLAADTSVIALAPDEFDRGAFLEPEPALDVGILAFFRYGPERGEAYSQMIFMNDLHTYEVPQTNVWLATAGPLNADSELASIVRPLSSLEVFQLDHFGRLGPNGVHLGAQDPRGVALSGPFVRLPAGRYEVRYSLLVNHLPAIGGELRIDVADSHGQRVLATHAQTPRPNDRQISLPFSVPEGGSVDLEVRYWHDGLSDVTVQHVSISRKDAEDLLPALGQDSPTADIPTGVWEEMENGWSGVWTPRPGGTNIFDAVWTQGTHKITAELSIKRSGNVITITRSGASDNNDLTYVGLITGRKVSGRYPGGRWSAEIRVVEQ